MFTAIDKSPETGGPRCSPGRRRDTRRTAFAVAGLLLLVASTLAAQRELNLPESRIQTRPPEERFTAQRREMVDVFVQSRGVQSPRVLSAMLEVPRHLFVPERERADAYSGDALSVDNQFSVSEPYAVARMTELLNLTGSERILEIGTGTGYHTAVLAQLSSEVHSMEIVPERAEAARELLDDLGYENAVVHVGNGYDGLPDLGPFDAIVLTAAPEEIPQALIDQLKVGGRMVVPVGGFLQELQVLEKRADGEVRRRRVDVVRMRPMVDVTDERPRQPPI